MIYAVLAIAGGILYVNLSDQKTDYDLGVFTGIMAGVGLLGEALWQLLAAPQVKPNAVSAADRLSQAVQQQWATEVTKRFQHVGLQDNPIDVSWQFAADDEGPGRRWQSADDLVRPAEIPGTDLAAVRNLSGGGTADLCNVSLCLPRGRLVIQGPPGSGKTAILLRMLIRALNHRKQQTAEVRAAIPVPVLLSLADWQPAASGIVEFAAETLARDIPSLRADSADGPTLSKMIRSGQVCLLLDGLEETTDHHLVIRELNDLPSVRVVLTSWPATYAAAVAAPRKLSKSVASAPHGLRGSAVVELLPVSESAIRDYLEGLPRFRRHPHELDQLLQRLMTAPTGDTLLNSPLYLSLIAEFYGEAGPADLLNEDDFPTTKSIAAHLIEEIIPRAYPDDRGYAAADVMGWLSYLATRMTDEPGATPDSDQAKPLSWSYLSEWAPAWLTRSVYGGCVGLLLALASWIAVSQGPPGEPVLGEVTAYVPLIWGIASGVGYVLALVLDLRQTGQPVVGIAIGVAAGVGMGMLGGLLVAIEVAKRAVVSPQAALLLGTALGCLLAIGLARLVVKIGLRERMRERRQWPSSFGRGRPSWRTMAVLAVLAGLFLLAHRSSDSVILVTLSFVIAVWAESLVTAQESMRGATSGRQSVRHDLAAWAALGVVVGICGTLLWGTAFQTRTEALPAWFAALFLITVLSSHTSGYLLAVGYLAATHRLPIAPLRFLEDAWRRDVMRRNGWRYEFRHRILLEKLRDMRTSPDPVTASTAEPAGPSIDLRPGTVVLPEAETQPQKSAGPDASAG